MKKLEQLIIEIFQKNTTTFTGTLQMKESWQSKIMLHVIHPILEKYYLTVHLKKDPKDQILSKLQKERQVLLQII